MSIQTEITRLQGLKAAIRSKLAGMGIISSGSATLEECKDAIEGIADNGAVDKEISEKTDTYTVPKGYHNGSGSVKIADAEQAKIIADNIKSGVTILGVAGAYAGEAAKLQHKSVTPTESEQTVVADEGYTGLSDVTVGAIPDNYADISGTTASAADVLATKVFVGADGEQTAGTMPNNGAVSKQIDGLTETSYTIPAGYHSGVGTVTLTDDIETALASI